MIVIIIIFMVWSICGAFAYALTMFDFTTTFPEMNHNEISWGMAVFGPAGLFVVLLVAKHRGLMWKPYSVEYRWELFKKDSGILGRDYFDKFFK